MERSGTVDKALRVLEVLHQARAPLSLAELSRELSIPKPTAHRLLASLLNAALVEQQADARYALGVGLVRLGLGALALDPQLLAGNPGLSRVSAAAVKRARTRGYDVNEAEWLPGLTVVAAPITLHGELLGCVTCAGPAVRLNGARLKVAIEATCGVAERVSRSLQGRK